MGAKGNDGAKEGQASKIPFQNSDGSLFYLGW